MDERIIQLVRKFIPDADVLKLYKDESGQVKIDIQMSGTVMAVSLKKNHAGELYIE